MPACDVLKIDKWTGVLLRIPKGRQLHNAASNSFGRSRCQTTRSLRIAIPVSGKAPPCRARRRARLSERRGPCARTSCAQHERRHDCGGVSCDILGRSCPPACLAEGFSALPPVSPVLLTLVRVYSSVGSSPTRTRTANRSAGIPVGRRSVSCMSVSNASVSLFGF